MGRTAIIVLVFLLLLSPVASAWCVTVCMAHAISSGCAHGLQPTDDLPVTIDIPVTVDVVHLHSPAIIVSTPLLEAPTRVVPIALRL